MRHLLLTSAAALILAACGAPESPETTTTTTPVETPTSTQETSAVEAETARLNAWFDEKYEEQLLRSPISLTQLGRKEKYDQIDDISVEAQKADLDWQLATAAEMEANFDRDMLTDEAKISYDLWLGLADRAEEGWKWRQHGYVFEQMGGWQTFPADFLIAYHRVDTEADAEAYIARIDGFATAMGLLIEQAKASAEIGVRPPKFAYRGALEQAKNLVSGFPFEEGEDNSILSDFKTKAEYLVESEAITQERADEMISEAEAALSGEFKTTYDELINWLETDVENSAESFGISELPDGEAYYNYRLASATTTDLTADEVHAFVPGGFHNLV